MSVYKAYLLRTIAKIIATTRAMIPP